jgi:hypothetical protein
LGWASTWSRLATSSARSLSWLPLSLVAALALAGCYASTEPATDVGRDTATLHARGTANNGAATSWFQYWETGSSQKAETEFRHWPAGASGPFSAKVTGLAANRAYSFRVCGFDDNNLSVVCGQTRAFKTTAATEDSVTGSWDVSPHLNGTVDAHSGPAGQSPHGSVSDVYAPITYNAFQGFVTCLAVDGNKAAVGAVGQATGEDGQTKQPATLLLTIVDSPAGDTLGRDQEGGSTPPNCATASFDQQGSLGSASTLIVNDAP